MTVEKAMRSWPTWHSIPFNGWSEALCSKIGDGKAGLAGLTPLHRDVVMNDLQGTRSRRFVSATCSNCLPLPARSCSWVAHWQNCLRSVHSQKNSGACEKPISCWRLSLGNSLHSKSLTVSVCWVFKVALVEVMTSRNVALTSAGSLKDAPTLETVLEAFPRAPCAERH